MKRTPVVIGLATLTIAATVVMVRPKQSPSSPRAETPRREVKITPPVEESPREAASSPKVEEQVARHFGLTEEDRRRDPTYRTAFLGYGEIRAAGRLESYRRLFELTDDQAARLRQKLEAEELNHADAEWARFDAIRRDVAERPGTDVKSAIEEAWRRRATVDPAIGRAERIRRAKEGMDAWDRELLAVFDPAQAGMLRDVKAKNADWMTDPDRHASVISDLGDMFTAKGLALSRSQALGIARAVKAHAHRNAEILGSLPFETHGFPVGLIEWSDPLLLAELSRVLSQDRFAVIQSWTLNDQ